MSTLFVRQAPPQPKSEWTPTPPGAYAACLVRIYDKGTFQATYKNDDGSVSHGKKRELVFEYELNIKRDGSDYNRTETVYAPFSHSPKSKFIMLMTSWLGTDIPPVGGRWDFNSLINRFAYISIVPYDKKNGSKGAKVGSIMPCPKSMEFDLTTKKSFFWSVEQDPAVSSPDVPERHKKTNEYFNGALDSEEHLAYLYKQNDAAFQKDVDAKFGPITPVPSNNFNDSIPF